MRFGILISIVWMAWGLAACVGPRHADKLEESIEHLVSEMTLHEKIGQMNQINGRTLDKGMIDQIKSGSIGSILNVKDGQMVNILQRIAMEEGRLGIPLLIARDVIHGYKTIFPIPLGQAASFNPKLVEKGARIAAIEATEEGIRWTFAPMMDISRDPRWGRIAESFGEDTYLTKVMAIAMIDGFQGNNLNDPTSMAACAKHFIGYGASEGGKDYNSTYVPERQMRNVYLPPFDAAVKGGCASIMTSFNDNDGVPASGNKTLLTNILRDEWGFDGVVVSDWASVHEMVTHGICKDDKDAAQMAVNAGLDMEMESQTYLRYIEELIEEDKVDITTIDNAVRNILRLKMRLGLFEDPYISVTEKSKAYSDEHLKIAQKAAEESLVLLKNERNTLPLSSRIKKIAVVGPLANAPHDQMGTWVFDGEKEYTITPLKALKQQYGDSIEFNYEPGLNFSRDTDRSQFDKAITIARSSDAIIFFAGEESILSGEAHSLANLDLKGAQKELIKLLKNTGKPLITVIMAGRPLTIKEEVEASDALLYAWHPGTMGGPAIANVLFGVVSPSGKSPITFPKEVGQIPIYYNHNNTGRPAKGTEVLIDDIPLEARQSSLGNTSYYLDAGFEPLFPFGFGLSYTTFEYTDLTIQTLNLANKDTLQVSVQLRNSGNLEGTEVVQLYVNKPIASITRPVKELKNFKRVSLLPGESKLVKFDLPISELAFWGFDVTNNVESGLYNLMIGGNSEEGLSAQFRVKNE